MTNDSSDSGEHRTDTSGYLNTPLATRKKGGSDVLNISAKRQLFTKETNREQMQQNATTSDQSISPHRYQMAPQQQQSEIGRTFDIITSPPRKSNQRTAVLAAVSPPPPSSNTTTTNATVNYSMALPSQKFLQNMNPVIILSPLDAEILQKARGKRSAMPLDVVLTPPSNFQNSRKMNEFENDDDDDDVIVEASPATRAIRRSLVEQHNFEEVCPFISLLILIYVIVCSRCIHTHCVYVN